MLMLKNQKLSWSAQRNPFPPSKKWLFIKFLSATIKKIRFSSKSNQRFQGLFFLAELEFWELSLKLYGITGEICDLLLRFHPSESFGTFNKIRLWDSKAFGWKQSILPKGLLWRWTSVVSSVFEIRGSSRHPLLWDPQVRWKEFSFRSHKACWCKSPSTRSFLLVGSVVL